MGGCWLDADGCIDRWMDGWVGRLGGWIDLWINECVSGGQM